MGDVQHLWRGRATAAEHPMRRVVASVWFDLAVATATSCLLALAVGLFALPATVDELSFENPTPYDVSIAVSRPGDDGWQPVLTVGHGRTGSTGDVVDQGDVWRFRFRGQGRPAGDLTITRAELEHAGWHVTLPDSVGERLAAQGAPLPP
jgi:hypothetical protein